MTAAVTMDKTTFLPSKNHAPARVLPVPTHNLAFAKAYGLAVVGFNRKTVHEPKSDWQPRQFAFHGISHLLSGRGWRWTPATGAETVEPGQMIVTCAGSTHYYGGNNSVYVEDAVSFFGPTADYLQAQGLLRDGVYSIGAARKLLPIIDGAADPALSSQVQAALLVQELLLSLPSPGQAQRPAQPPSVIQQLLRRLQAEPQAWWTINEMAEYCNLSANQFRRRFYDATGLAPKRYLDQLKLQLAAELLCGSRLSITAIAARLGYRDPFHFSRRFRQIMRQSPQNYRQQMTLI